MASNIDSDHKHGINVQLIDSSDVEDIDNVDEFEPSIRGKRFEIEKINENTILIPFETLQINQRNINDTCGSNYSTRSKSSLKKTSKKYEHDDSFEKRNEEFDKAVDCADADDAEDTGCMKINYDRQNRLDSVTFKLKTPGSGASDEESKNWFYGDLITFHFYRRLLAEYLGIQIVFLL
jgi:hypothetical protein